MWQAEADAELTLSASPTTAVGQKALALAKRRYSTVYIASSFNPTAVTLAQKFMPFLSRVKFFRAVSSIWNVRVMRG